MRFIYLLAATGLVASAPLWANAKTTHKPHKTKVGVHHVVKKTKKNPIKRMPAAPVFYDQATLQNTIDHYIAEDGVNAQTAVFVKSMKTGQTLYARNVDQPLTPASTLKIFTAEAALIYLGPGYQFSTRLMTDARSVQNGMLQGNLYIILTGDPSLDYSDILELLQNLRTQQINAIAGNVYIDDSAYDKSFYGPGWDERDKGYCYAAPISASIINHNCLPIQIAPSKVSGHPAEVITSSKFFYPHIKNTVITKTKSSRSCSLRVSNNENSYIEIDGCMPAGHYAWGMSYVVTDIPEYNRALFKGALNHLMVNVFGNVIYGSTVPANLSLIASHESQPLRVLINQMLKKSDNIIAGALFKKIGQVYHHQAGSWENGSLAVSKILAERANVNTTGMRILDGSGLSNYNLATPAQMMQVLNYVYHDYPTSYEFISSLPISGVDGTLKHRMGNIAHKIRAKTGTISGVTTLAGYAETVDKQPLAFVIMINGSKGMGWRYKAMEDKIATALTRYRD